MPKAIISGNAGERKLLLGNEAIARGALEAGISAAAAYPGTPSTEIIESLVDVAGEYGIYVEWSTNEKVALELGIGVSMMGLRSLVAMKHVGLNVASDPLMSLGYTGVIGGLVIVTADDPNAHSSQNEQDNRLYGIHANIPVFEPSTVQEAKDLTKALFEVSEKFQLSVILRTTTRLSHSRSPVVFGEVTRPSRDASFHKNPERWALLPPYNLVKHREVLERLKKLEEYLSEFRFNSVVKGEDNVAVVTSGITYNYVLEAVEELGVKPTIYKLSSVFPLPRKIALEILNYEKVIVVEELEPVIEWQLKIIGYEEKTGAEIYGKTVFPRVGELNKELAKAGIAAVTGIEYKPPEAALSPPGLPRRPPVLCPGCGHRSTYYAVKLAAQRARVKPIYANDIGCYTLGFYPPYEMADFTWSMGSSIGIGLGIARFSKEPVIAFIGDSTFYHAGIPALINAVYNKTPLLVIVMDNSITAMTGHQPHPGSGVGPSGESRPQIKIEDVARAVGVKFVEVVDAYDVTIVRDTVQRALRYIKETGEVAVIVSRRPCALLDVRNRRRRGEEIRPYIIDEAKCINCGICVDKFACPAIVRENSGKPRILAELCVGCGVCASICPAKAIRPAMG
ncbi:MAG: indolepyruvate ferredoxin oxidoreductase subunit alpha [Infirmifilum sp.]|uniref:indolepyruvate ferredoxin oxidoreductase subunit alpha n=1 Tax=Infirmifilum TaxID=2856573 RepID=UPI002354B620